MSGGVPWLLREPIRGGFPSADFYSLSGIEQMRAFQRNLVPPSPMVHLLGHRLTQVGSGTATMMVRLTPWFQLPDGSVDASVLTEQSMSAAVRTGVPAGLETNCAAMSMHHLRYCGLDSESLVARARVVHSARAFSFVESIVEDGLGRTVAHSTASYVNRPIVPPPPPLLDDLQPWVPHTYAEPDPYLRPLPDGVLSVRGFDGADGLDFLREVMASGRTIPAFELVGLRLVEAGPRACSVTMPASEWVAKLWRIVSPGAVGFVGAMAMQGALTTMRPAGRRIAVIDQSMTFLQPVAADDGDLLGRASVSHRGEGLLVAEGEVVDHAGTIVAVGRQTAVLVEAPGRRAQMPAGDRVLLTVMFTDIVGSTVQAARLGDAAWQELLAEHHAGVRRWIGQFRGREVKTAGDGFLVTFDSPARAIQCARAVRDEVARLGLEIRAGLHVGECELVDGDIAGVAVHVASRVQALAEPKEILVTSTVRDAAAGSGLAFADRGARSLRGLDGRWHLFAVEG